MPNGTMLKQLRKMADDDDIDMPAALKLSLAAHAETLEIAINNREEINKVGAELKELNELKDLKDLKENYAVRFGKFVKDHPWTTTAVFALFAFFANLWFISGFRIGVMKLLNFPQEWIDLLVP